MWDCLVWNLSISTKLIVKKDMFANNPFLKLKTVELKTLFFLTETLGRYGRVGGAPLQCFVASC